MLYSGEQELILSTTNGVFAGLDLRSGWPQGNRHMATSSLRENGQGASSYREVAGSCRLKEYLEIQSLLRIIL